MKTIAAMRWATAALILTWAPVAQAHSPETGSPAAIAEASKVADTGVAAPRGESAPLLDDELARERGGQALVLSDQTLESLVQGNSIEGGYQAGDVTIADSALANFNGFGNLVINTGAQTSLQAAMNITINIAGD